MINMFICKINKSVLVTYIGVFISVLGIYLAFQGQVKFAVMCLMATGVCDLFDGVFARSCKRTEREKLMGVQIDSLADVVGFLILPIVIAFSIGLNSWLSVVVAVIYVLCGITRLGHFNLVADSNGPVKYYSGLPVTFAAIIFPIIWLVLSVFPDVVQINIYLVALVLASIFFVINVRIIKPKGLAYLFLLALFILISVIILAML